MVLCCCAVVHDGVCDALTIVAAYAVVVVRVLSVASCDAVRVVLEATVTHVTLCAHSAMLCAILPAAQARCAVPEVLCDVGADA